MGDVEEHRQRWECCKCSADVGSLQYFLRQTELEKDRRGEHTGT